MDVILREWFVSSVQLSLDTLGYGHVSKSRHIHIATCPTALPLDTTLPYFE